MKGSFLGAISLAITLTVASCEPAHAVDAVCVTADQYPAMDQAEVDKVEGLKGYTAAVVQTIQGDAAKSAGAMLATIGAPPEVASADTFILIAVTPPEGGMELNKLHIIAFKDGCKTGGGLHPEGGCARVGG